MLINLTNKVETPMNKIYLGIKDGTHVHLEKHIWDCGWYWGFGYVVNCNSHMHMSSIMKPKNKQGNLLVDWTDVNNVFESTWIPQDLWYIILDSFRQAYTLKDAARVYRYGGHITNNAPRIVNAERAASINKDIETILNTVWRYLEIGINHYDRKGV